MSTAGYERVISQNTAAFIPLQFAIGKRNAADPITGQAVPGAYLSELANIDLTTITSMVAQVTLPGSSTSVPWTFLPVSSETTPDYLVVERLFASAAETALTGRAQFDCILFVGSTATASFFAAVPIQAKR